MLIPYKLIYNFILDRCITLSIDESHAVKHSMDVLKYTQKIYNEELLLFPELKKQKKIMYTSAMLHDMCDSKYMDVDKGLNDIKEFIETINYDKKEIDIILKIIGTMSYSKVKKNGFPDLKEYQKSYHIVREADLLCGYDVERCIVFGMIGKNMDYDESVIATKELYNIRMAKQIEDNLFTTQFGLKEAKKLDKENKIRLEELNDLIINN
jgi:HD superfamily phosphodiesterase